VKFLLIFVMGALVQAGATAQAADMDGDWAFERAADYAHPQTPVSAPPISRFKVVGETLLFGPGCHAHLRYVPYHPGGPFQMLLKKNAEEAGIAKFLTSTFDFNFAQKSYYKVESNAPCNRQGRALLLSGDKLISIYAGSTFYEFSRVRPSDAHRQSSKGAVDLQGLKVSELPFDVSAYTAHCEVPRVKDVPQTTAKCAPLYFPYVASRATVDKVSKLVGAHEYQKHGALSNSTQDYDNPVAHGLHPVFLVFPPLGDVLLVRVDDMEGSEDDRDSVGGMYLAIKSGVVTDQLNSGCSFDQHYTCSGDGTAVYQLMEAGQFKRLK
jgi:hypothetical protein